MPRSIVPATFAALALVTVAATAQQADTPARAVVLRAQRAVETDSADILGARWREALVRDSTDHEARLGLATLARWTYDFPTAERHFTGLLPAPGRAPDGWAVQARIGLYSVANARGQQRVADSILRIASTEAHRLGDRGARIDILFGFTNTRTSSEAALYATLDTINRLLPTGDGSDRAEYFCRLGLFRGVGGDSAASTILKRGLAMAQRVGDRQLAGHCLEANGLLQSKRGANDSALATYDTAAAILRATHEHAGIARIESRRSDILQAYGRLGEAKVALSNVLAGVAISKNRQRESNAYGGLGQLALLTGDLPTAARWFERAARLNDSLGQGEGARIARQNRAMVLAAQGDLPAAKQAFEVALAAADSTGFFEDVVIAREELARLAIRRRDWADADRQLALGDSAARARGMKDMAAGFEYERGRIALGRGDGAEAARHFSAILSQVDSTDHLVRYTARTRLAESYVASRQLDRAERELTVATDELERWRATLDAQDLRRYAFAATTLGEHDPQAAVARVIAALAGAGRVDAAFTLAERRRARTLADRLVQGEALFEGGTAGRDRGMAVAHRDRGAATNAIVAAMPDDRTAILEYVAGNEGAPTTLFVATRGGVKAQLLPSADSLAKPIERFAALLESGASAEGLSRALGAAVLGPAAAVLPEGVTHLIVVPDGPLHRVAFDALMLPDGKLALERWSVGLAPSAAVATVLRRSGGRADSRSVAPGEGAQLLALGDPAFAGEKEIAQSRDAETFRGAFDESGGLPRLAASGDEVRTVARYAPGGAAVRLRSDASEAWIKGADLGRFSVIHLATHALVDESSLARTSLALAPGAGEDGFLSPADLSALKLHADLVVLSACRTAVGVAVTGEGLQGLTAPLLEAGARSIVATRWRIGDRSTVRLVQDFYDGLAHGMPVSDALRTAKLAAMHRGQPASEWAAFTVIGDPLVRVGLREPTTSVPWAGLVLGVVSLLVVGYFGVRWRGRSGERTVRASDVVARTHQR
jgi:CHAT domain-containing protein